MSFRPAFADAADWNAGYAFAQSAQMSQRLRGEGVPMHEFRATTQNFSPAIIELDAATRSGRLRHDGNPVLEWCLGNVVGKAEGAAIFTRPRPGRIKRSRTPIGDPLCVPIDKALTSVAPQAGKLSVRRSSEHIRMRNLDPPRPASP
jgi:hypothetical protein